MFHSFAPMVLAALCTSARPEPAAATSGALTITCPPLAKVFCGDSTDLKFTGTPTVTGECDPTIPATLDHTDSIQPNDCPAERIDYVIVRTWTATTPAATPRVAIN